ncbi:MAG: geranylgeranylglyceryl/heptaprenylglyceryl phosphate synthase [Candidatus Verstraetearchaeota archaeon]|jgi:phosphoglycerol geranylgeranyltransferase|nr:geranylgeranylglyceryl/heptaprenylglyceryl phosphate synthase [Candidatus Verstraetearchaeota archaeon]
MLRRVEKYLVSKIKEKGCIHIALIDPEKCNPEDSKYLSKIIKEAGSTAIMVGGSTYLGEKLDEIIKGLKDGSDLPVIIFPGNIASISKYADAIWFLSVLNSSNPYYITGAQAISARIIKSYNLEAIPLAYIIISPGGTAGFVSQANPIPIDKPEIITMYALAAQYMGMRFIYLERGSGASEPIPANIVRNVREMLDESHLIVGGGIKNKEQAKELAKAGAEIIVTGTILENNIELLKDIVDGIEEGVNAKSY